MTTSFELSKQLWDLGLKIGTEKCWQRDSLRDSWKIMIYKVRGEYHIEYLLPAYSTDELLAVMPKEITIIHIGLLVGGFCISFETANWKDNLHLESDKSLPEAIGLMCEWLLDNGYHYDSEKKELVK